MIYTTIMLASATLGVEKSWQQLDDGGIEYIIQIEPSLLELLENGEALTSEIPLELHGLVRRYRIIVGDTPLRPPPETLPASSPLPTTPANHENRGLNNPTSVYPRGEDRRVVVPQSEDHNSDDAEHLDTDETQGPYAVDTGGRYSTKLLTRTQQGETSVQEKGISEKSMLAGTSSNDELEGEPLAGSDLAEEPTTGQDSGHVAGPPSKIQTDPNIEQLSHDTSDPPPEPLENRENLSGASSQSSTLLSTVAISPKPWKPLLVTLMGLFVSLGTNVYLGWVTWNTRKIFRTLIQGRA